MGAAGVFRPAAAAKVALLRAARGWGASSKECRGGIPGTARLCPRAALAGAVQNAQDA